MESRLVGRWVLQLTNLSTIFNGKSPQLICQGNNQIAFGNLEITQQVTIDMIETFNQN